MRLAAGDRVGDWIVQGPLGEGGMGEVYAAHNALSERVRAALKIVKPAKLSTERGRFLREVEALHTLDHPAIVRLLSFGVDEERQLMYCAMQLMEGDTLRTWRDKGPMPLDLARWLFAQLADGLAHAHAVGIHHRDIKPSNVIVAADASRATLLDFGIALQQDRTRLTAVGVFNGTPAYMPPEVFETDDVDHAAGDVYALGQIMYEALTGGPLIEYRPELTAGQVAGRVMRAKLSVEPLDPGDRVPQAMRGLIKLATARNPAGRPTMAELAAGLRDPKLVKITGTHWVQRHTSHDDTYQAAPVSRAPRSRIGLYLMLVLAALAVVAALLVVAVAAGMVLGTYAM